MVDPLSPVFRDGLPGTFAESPLTKQERELQGLEGRPPLEVTPAGTQGIRGRRKPDPDVRWRPSRVTPGQDGAEEEGPEPEESDPGPDTEAEKDDAEKTEEGSSGRLLDSRS
jgi:hypothetical protein